MKRSIHVRFTSLYFRDDEEMDDVVPTIALKPHMYLHLKTRGWPDTIVRLIWSFSCQTEDCTHGFCHTCREWSCSSIVLNPSKCTHDSHFGKAHIVTIKMRSISIFLQNENYYITIFTMSLRSFVKDEEVIRCISLYTISTPHNFFSKIIIFFSDFFLINAIVFSFQK